MSNLRDVKYTNSKSCCRKSEGAQKLAASKVRAKGSYLQCSGVQSASRQGVMKIAH